MTPGKPDIDFKLDGAKWDFIYLGRGVCSHNHILGIYLLLSDSTEPIQGGRLRAQLIWINVLWSMERPVFSFFLYFLQNLPGVSPSGNPWTHFSRVSESALSQTSGFLHQHVWLSYLLSQELVYNMSSSPSSTPQTFSQSAQTDRNRIYHTCKLSESQT